MKTLLAVLLLSLLSFAQSPTKGGQPSTSTGNNVFSSKQTFSGGLTVGVAGAAGAQQTINTKLGTGQLHVNAYLTNTVGNSPVQFDSLGYSEQLCGTSVPASSFTGGVVQNFTFGAAASADCTRVQVLGLNSVARLAGGSWSSLSVEERSFEADLSQNSTFDPILNSTAAAGDTNHTGVLAQSTGTNEGGIGIWAHSSTASNVWKRGIVSDSYDSNGYAFEAKGDGAIHFLCETATANQTCAFYFNDAGTTEFTLGKNTTNDFVLFDAIQPSNRFVARSGANGNIEIRANGSGSVQFNGNVASISSAGLGTFNGGANLNNAGLAAVGAVTGVTTLSASGQITSTLATGTAPLSISSTTPVANLTLSQHPQAEYCGATSGATQACAKTVLTTPFIVQGDVQLNTATTQSITTLPFTNANYSCTGSDLTTTTGTVFFNTYANASVTIGENGGVNTDHLRYICVGN